MQKNTPLKDVYDRAYIERLAGAFRRERHDFDQAAFEAAVFTEDWYGLELKARMLHIAGVVDRMLPDDFAKALEVLDPVARIFDGLPAILFPAVIELRVMRDVESLWDLAVAAFARYTVYSTSELAVRPLILADQQRMLAQMLRWAYDEDHHVRRLASEGCRPRLPWAMALPELKRDPAPLLAILEALQDDESEYVRRSVANNLNDIAKGHPELVLEIAERWLAGEPCSRNRRRLVKHACRTILKVGSARAMALFGFRDPGDLCVEGFRLDREVVCIGGELTFHFSLRFSSEARVPPGGLGRIRLEYVVHYQKKNGSLTPKVFKLSEFDTSAPVREVTRRHAFRELSTRRLHPGTHELELRVNGVEKARLAFQLADF